MAGEEVDERIAGLFHSVSELYCAFCLTCFLTLSVTENTYLKDLEVIISVFYNPLLELAKSGLIPSKEMWNIFSNIADVYQLNKCVFVFVVCLVFFSVNDCLFSNCTFRNLLEQLDSVCKDMSIENFQCPPVGNFFLNMALLIPYLRTNSAA